MAICFYLSVRVIVFAEVSHTAADFILGLLLLLAEIFMLIHTIAFMWEIIKARKEPSVPKMNFDKTSPSVSVIVAARNEPRSVLIETFTTLQNLDYPNLSIFLLDDSTNEKSNTEADEIGKLFGITVMRRAGHEGAKAGAINNFLIKCKSKYVAIFDADQHPVADFLKKTIPVLEKDDKIAFVQTPQFYSNYQVSPIAEGAAMQQAIFYESICEGKSAVNAMFCCGTNVVFRVEALKSIEGFEENSITEDFATSLKLQTAGWKSYYYRHVSAFGLAPKTLPTYFKQQARWAAGTTDTLRHVIKLLFTRPRSMTLSQWIEYLLSGSYYFMGGVYFILVLCPIIFLIFGVPNYFLLPEIYFAAYIPYMVMAFMLFYISMGSRSYTVRQAYIGSIMGNISFPILMKATVYGLFGKKMPFEITNKSARQIAGFGLLWPHITIILIAAVALGIGVARLTLGEDPWAIGVNIFWVCYHFFVLSSVFYFNLPPRQATHNLDRSDIIGASNE